MRLSVRSERFGQDHRDQGNQWLIPSFEIGIERTGNVEVCGLDPAACKTYELAGKVGSVFQNPKSQVFII